MPGKHENSGGQDASAVEAEAGAGGAEMVGKEFGEIDGVARVDAEGEKAEDWQDAKELPVFLRQVAGYGDHDKGHDVHEGEGAAPAESHSEGTEGEQAKAATGGFDPAIGDVCAFGRIGSASPVAEKKFPGKIQAGDGNTPETAEADSSEQHAEEGTSAPSGIAQEVAEAAHFRALSFGGFFGGFPGFGFLDGSEDPDDEERGQEADEIGVTPVKADGKSGERSDPGAEDAGGVENPGGVGAGVFGKDFGDEAGSDGPFTADAEGDEETQGGDLPEGRGKIGEAGKNGIEQDSDDERGTASPFVGEGTEKHAAESAAKKEEKLQEIGIFFNRRVFAVGVEDVREKGVVGDDVDLAFKGVEDPAGGGDGEDEPLVAGDAGIPAWSG